MEKRSQSTAGIIIVVILILGIIATAVYFAVTYKKDNTASITEGKTTKLLLKVIDPYDNSILESGLCVFKNKLFNKCYTTTSIAWNELNLSVGQNYTFYINKSGYYSDIFTIENLYELYPNVEIPLRKIGIIEISHGNKLAEGVSDLIIDLNVVDNIKRLQVCSTWSKGLIYARIKPQPLSCGSGWVNCTRYEQIYERNKPINKCVEPLPEKQNYCLESSRYESCDKIEGTFCYLKQIEPPKRLEKKVNSCTYIGKDLYNEKYLLELETKGDLLDNTDYVEIYFVDLDLINEGNEFKHLNEYNGKDVGYQDKIYRITNL